METPLSSLAVPHDVRLVLLSLGMGAATSFVTFTLYAHLLTRSRGRTGWLMLTALCAGAGIWTAHFIAGLAVAAPLRAYHPLPGALALACAIALAALAIWLSTRPGRAMATAGGAILGGGIALTHFLGMAGFDFVGAPQWQPPLAAVATFSGIALSAAAMLALREYPHRRALILGTALLAAAIAATLLLAMSAFTLLPEPAATWLGQELIDRPLFAMIAAGVAALVLGAGYIAARLEAWAMRATFSRLDELIDALVEGVVIADRGKIVSVNARMLDLTGQKPHELIGRQVFGGLLEARYRQFTPNAVIKFDAPVLARAGKTIPAQIVRRPLHGLARATEIYAIRDLREQVEAAERMSYLSGELKRCQQDLRQRNFLLEGVLANMSQGLCMFDADQRVVLANARYAAIYGLSPESVAPGTHLRDILQKRIDKGLFAGGSPAAYMEERLAPIERAGENMLLLSDGRQILVNRRPMPGGGWVTTHEDVTERRRIEAQNQHLTQHDSLTDLPNRELIGKLLEAAMAAASGGRRRLVVLMLDLDNFRHINDTLGHATGDALLKAVAERLRRNTRKTTILGRFGDDEFLLVEAAEQPGRDAAVLAGRIQEQLRAPFKLAGREIVVDCTVGIAIFPADGADATTLLKSADLALSRAKQDARGTARFFETAMERDLQERLALERDLAQALAKSQLVLHYQPLVSLSPTEVNGFEALLRWQHPVRGLMLPADFLPVAEAAGLMPAIEEWTLRQACTEAMRWPEPLKVAVNISAARFKSGDFAQSVLATLAATGLNARRLEIEISERAIQADPENALRTMRQLGQIGVRLALDDFGTGFASLNYLRQFPIQRVKVHRSFVTDSSAQGDGPVILRTLARLGAGFGVATTAQGVETKEELELVRAEGFTEMQGFYFSPPRTAEEIRLLFLAKAEDAVA